MQCERAKHVCEYLHPRKWYAECITLSVDPLDILFTHNKLHSAFQDGMSIDTAIDKVKHGSLKFSEFPKMEVVCVPRAALSRIGFHALSHSRHGEVDGALRLSLNNRRLFAARVLRNLGFLQCVKVVQYDFHSARVQRPDECAGDDRPKWQRALTTQTNGESVKIDSKYSGLEKRTHAGSALFFLIIVMLFFFVLKFVFF